MIKRKVKKRRNPELQARAEKILSLLQPVSIKYLAEGDYAEVYKFEISFRTRVPFVEKENIILQPGTYVLKMMKPGELLDLKSRNFLKKLSKKKLIPEIYVISETYIIMKYIDATPLRDIISEINPSKLERIFYKLGKLVDKYHEAGYSHSDLNSANILVDKENEVYLIDPKINEQNFAKDHRNLQYYYEYYLD